MSCQREVRHRDRFVTETGSVFRVRAQPGLGPGQPHHRRVQEVNDDRSVLRPRAAQADSRSPRERPRLTLASASAGCATTANGCVGEPFKGITTDGTVVPGLFPLQATGRLDRADPPRGDRVSGRARPEPAAAGLVRRQLGRVAALVEHPPVPDAPRPAAGRPVATAARGRAAAGRAHAQRERVPHRARRHAAEPHGRRDHRQLDRVRRVGLLHQRVRRAVGARAVGLADRRPSPDRQLLRPRRSAGDHAAVHGLRAGGRRDGHLPAARACCSPSRTRGWRSSTR